VCCVRLFNSQLCSFCAREYFCNNNNNSLSWSSWSSARSVGRPAAKWPYYPAVVTVTQRAPDHRQIAYLNLFLLSEHLMSPQRTKYRFPPSTGPGNSETAVSSQGTRAARRHECSSHHSRQVTSQCREGFLRGREELQNRCIVGVLLPCRQQRSYITRQYTRLRRALTCEPRLGSRAVPTLPYLRYTVPFFAANFPLLWETMRPGAWCRATIHRITARGRHGPLGSPK
jgi:hypothetical protein